MRGRITKRAVDALIPAGGKETVIWDTEVRGFGVRVRPLGTQGELHQDQRPRTYLVRYRPGAGGRSAPLRTHIIGRHGSPWTPEAARAEAKRILGRVEAGDDPGAQRRAHRGAPSVSDLCARFLAEHVDIKRKRRTAAEYRRLVDKIILPALGKKKVADVTRQDVGRLHHANRETPYQANRVLAVLSKIFNLAERWGERPDGTNPCRHVEKFKERSRERMLSGEELARLGAALATYDGSAYVVAAVKLLVFTGARMSEVLTLRWEWIDFDRAEARLPDSKSGAKTLHLPPPALAVLSELHPVEDNPYVIAGYVGGAPLADLEKPWRKIRRAAGLEDVRLHDLRHAFASVAASSGLGLPIIGKLLGHTQAATTQRYAHLAADPVKAAAAAIAGKIAGAMKGAAGGAEVVELPKRKA